MDEKLAFSVVDGNKNKDNNNDNNHNSIRRNTNTSNSENNVKNKNKNKDKNKIKKDRKTKAKRGGRERVGTDPDPHMIDFVVGGFQKCATSFIHNNILAKSKHIIIPSTEQDLLQYNQLEEFQDFFMKHPTNKKKRATTTTRIMISTIIAIVVLNQDIKVQKYSILIIVYIIQNDCFQD